MPEQHPGLAQRTRGRAYALWQPEGCPDGQAGQHWKRACAEHAAADHLVGIEEEDSFPASDPLSRNVVTALR